MITAYKGVSPELLQVDELQPDIWVHVVDPSTEELERLQQELGVPRDFVASALDADERARTDREGTVQLISLRIPYSLGETADVPFDTLPLSIVITDHTILTVCREESDIVQDLISGRVSGWSTDQPKRIILKLLLRTASRYLRHLRFIDRQVEALEDRLQMSMKNQELLELLKYQKSLVYFATALRSNELMMERLQKSTSFRMRPEDDDLLEDVLTENQQAIEMVNISSNILSQMMDAFASIISNNLNVVMKSLTAVTIVLMGPTLVASLYGMNVELPMQHSGYAFLIIIVISILTSLAVALFFLKKRWF